MHVRRKSEDGEKKTPSKSKRKVNPTPRTTPVHSNSLERANRARMQQGSAGAPPVNDGVEGENTTAVGSRPETPTSEWASVSKDSAISSMQVVVDASGEDSLEVIFNPLTTTFDRAWTMDTKMK